MSPTLLFIWIIGVAGFTVLGSAYARKYERPDMLIMLYVTFTLIAQILAVKISSFNFGFATFIGPSGVIIFSITFLLTDNVNEKFGREETQRMILLAFISQVATSLFFWLGTEMQPAPYWNLQGAWAMIFSAVPRITIASWLAFLVSENVDAYVFAWFKKVTHDKHLWARNVFSSIPSLTIDSLIFITVAFAGTMPLLPLIIGQTAVKWVVGVISIPFMYLNSWMLFKKGEGHSID